MPLFYFTLLKNIDSLGYCSRLPCHCKPFFWSSCNHQIEKSKQLFKPWIGETNLCFCFEIVNLCICRNIRASKIISLVLFEQSFLRQRLCCFIIISLKSNQKKSYRNSIFITLNAWISNNLNQLRYRKIRVYWGNI